MCKYSRTGLGLTKNDLLRSNQYKLSQDEAIRGSKKIIKYCISKRVK